MMLTSLFPEGVRHYLIGGLLIGAGVSLIFTFTGIVSGMSSVFTTTWSYVARAPFFQDPRFVSSRGWRLILAIGLVLGAILWLITIGPEGGIQTNLSGGRLLVGGVLVGFGARMSKGCTSGHGICGLASLQLPSLLAVGTFLTTAIIVANVLARFGGGVR